MICQNGTFLMLTAQMFYKMKQTTVEDFAGRGGGGGEGVNLFLINQTCGQLAPALNFIKGQYP